MRSGLKKSRLIGLSALAGLVIAAVVLVPRLTAGRAAVVPHSSHFHLTVQADHIISGPKMMTVNRGDDVKISATSVGYGEDNLVVSGYLQRAELDDADGTATIHFTADQAGTFPVYVESNGAKLGEFIVK